MRLRNAAGVIVNVDEATAEILGSDWVDADTAPAETAKRGRPKKVDESSADDK